MINTAQKMKRDKYGNTLQRKLFIIGMLIVPLTGFIVFTVYANLGGIILSFRHFNGTEEVFAGLKNYERFFKGMQSEEYLKTISVSLSWLGVVGCFTFPVSVLTAFFLNKKIPFAKWIIVFLYLPNIIPAALIAEFYRRMWDSGGGIVQTGLFNRLFGLIMGREINWLVSPQHANWALWIYTAWFGFGFNAILLWGAMSRVPKELIESAELDGAGLFTEFFKITIPVIWPTLSMVIILTLMVPSTIYMQPMLLADNGRYNTRTVALLVIHELKNYNAYYSAAISIIIAAVTLPVILTAKKLLEKVFTVVEI